ncbi:hypothetical protein CBR56_06640 [Bacillus thuringiensis]|nr:hypothetical protein DN398_01920 [Bacillus sp. JAS102]OTX89803.1 hypothetical protein BK728_04435 [Bacillus thuringiensis serovar chanpaisis]PNK32270.1 hypothetical protein CBR56_06640 [Bacillus thuringiensis]
MYSLNRRKLLLKIVLLYVFSEMLKMKSKMSKKYDKMLIVEVFLRTYNVTKKFTKRAIEYANSCFEERKTYIRMMVIPYVCP